MPEIGQKNVAGGAIAKTVLAADFISFYSNTLRAGLTPFDFLLSFGHIVVRGDDTFAEDKYEIRMSPQFFKTTIAQMNAVLAAYEQQFGEINTPVPVAGGIADDLKRAIAHPTPSKS
jgi:hypothetical protein